MGSFPAAALPLLHYGYAALFVIVALSAAYFPFPSSIALLVAGALSRTGIQGVHFDILITLAVGFVANITGDISTYILARNFHNEKRQEKFERRHTYFKKVRSALEHHPIGTIVVSRFIGFISPVVSTLAGFSKVPARMYVGSVVLGDGAYVLVVTGIGYAAGSVSTHTTTLYSIGAGVLVVIIAVYIGTTVLLRRNT